MSNAVFPSILGVAWDAKKTPVFATKIQSAVSGKELRLAYMATPLWQYTLNYEVLRSDARADLQTLLGFFLARQGSFDSFLYTDPNDSAVAAQLFGVGDGTTTAFQLLKSYGGYNEPVQSVNGAPLVFVNDWEGNQLQYATARTNLCWFSRAQDNAAWGKTRSSVTANALAGPDGSVSADKLIEDATAANSHFIATPVWTSTLAPYTYWIDAKADTRTRLQLGISSSHITGTGANAEFNLGTVVATAQNNCTAAITPLPATGWYRCSMTFTPTAIASGPGFAYLCNAAGSNTYNGDGASGLYTTNAQIELSSVPTSSINTPAGANVTVTDYALGSTGIVTFSPAPLNGAILTWTGNFYIRCRFMQDISEFNEFLNNFWDLKQLQFQSVKL